MTRQLENPKHSHETYDTQDGERGGLVVLFLLVGEYGAQCDKVGYDGHNVDDVHDALEKLELKRTAAEPEYKFKAEPDDAYCFDYEERLVKMRYIVFDYGERLVGLIVKVSNFVALEVWQCFDAEDDDAS